MALQMTWQPSLHRRKSGPPLGLRNLGNTCYINSVLQCLTYTPPLANFCLRNQHSDICQKLDANKKRENCPFCVLEKRIARSLNLEAANDAPSKIGSCLRLYADHFQWARQEDAHEFLRYVIDACHNTCLRLLKVSGANGRVLVRGGEGPTAHTIVKEIFGGSLLSQIKCLSCGAESNKTDEIMDISLDLYQSNSLKDALRRFFQAEVLDGDNKYKCEGCKKLSAARKQMYIHQAPNVLVIQLKRFEGINGGKISRDIAFEEVLYLNSFMIKSSKDAQSEYSLFGSIVHSGYSPESGHYYAYVKDPTGQWYCCNDAHVSPSTTQVVLSEKVYILFYMRSSSNKKLIALKNGLHNGEMKLPNGNGKNILKTQKSSVVKSASQTNGKSSHEQAISTSLNGSSVTAQHGKLDSLKDAPEQEKGNGHEHKICNGRYQTVGRSNGFSNHDNQNGKVKFSLINNKPNNHNRIAKIEKHDNGISSSMDNGACEQGSNLVCNIPLVKKRKSVCAEGSVVKLMQNAHCSDSSNCDDQSNKHSILEYNQPPGSLEKLKDVLAQDTSSALRSCGWYKEVEAFMRSQKRHCCKEVADSPNQIKLRLVAEAKKAFICHLPEELKGRLVRELKSFSERKPLSEK